MKALVLCGGMSQLRLLQILKQRNIYSILADMNPNAPAVQYADKFYSVSAMDFEGVKKIAVDEKVDMILSVCADQMILTASKISEELSLPCYIDYESAKNVSSKEYMKKIFVENNIPTSKHIVRAEVNEEDISDMTYPLVVKPVDAYSSRGVKKVQNYTELKAAFNNARDISRTKTAIIEEFVAGEEVSVDYYIENGEAKVLCIRYLDKIPESNGFIICRGIYPAPIPDDVKEQIKNIGQSIANSFNLTNTPMLAQMKIDNGKASVIEFCARTGGGIKYRLIPRVSGFDVVEAVLDLTLGNKPHYDGYQLDSYIVDEFIYCNPGELDHFEGFEELLRDGIIAHYDYFKKPGHIFGEIKGSGDRCAYYSVEADDIESLCKKHEIAANTIKAISKDGIDLIKHNIINFKGY